MFFQEIYCNDLLTIKQIQMKQFAKSVTYKKIVTLFILSLIQAMVFAQDSAVSSGSQTTTTTTASENTWYTQPWVWVVGGAVFLLLIVALVRSNSSSGDSRTDKVTYTKTTETDTP